MADPDDVIPAWGERPAPAGRGAVSRPTFFGLDPARVVALAVAALRPNTVAGQYGTRDAGAVRAEADQWVRWLRAGEQR